MDVTETDVAPAEVERVQHAPVSGPVKRESDRGQRARLERLASGVGNRSLARLVARTQDGEGILAGGIVHPDVEAAIAQSRGGGRALDHAVSRQLEPRYGESLADVRVHTGEAAEALARSVSARAFTVGSDIFFAPGEYRPGSRDGNVLIAHEVAHVLQQRGAPATGRLTVSPPDDRLEREAEALARDVTS